VSEKCPPHKWKNEWEREAVVTYCSLCGERWVDLMRGFGSNVQPSKRRPHGTMGAA
jgi:hypothetical protein